MVFDATKRGANLRIMFLTAVDSKHYLMNLPAE